jgi:hypothetical protein
VASGVQTGAKHRCFMVETQLLADLVQSCRLLAYHHQNPDFIDMLHDLEEDFIQKARDIESGKRRADREQARQYGERLRAASTVRSS